MATGQHGDCAVDRDTLTAWLKVATAANEARNRLMHSIWAMNEGEADTFTLTKALQLEPRSEADLLVDRQVMQTAVDGFADLRAARPGDRRPSQITMAPLRQPDTPRPNA